MGTASDLHTENRSPTNKNLNPMTKRPSRSQPRWTDVKAKLTSLDRIGLIGLVQDLYALHKDNQTFLHTRFGLGKDVLKPYKETLDRWLWPDVMRNQDISVAKAKQAISSYRKAVGEPAGLAELMVSYCENAAGFSNDVGYQDEGYFDALVHMFEQALKVTRQLSAADRDALIARLDRVRSISHNLGYGVGDDMDSLLIDYTGT
jgi:hypothetical protein